MYNDKNLYIKLKENGVVIGLIYQLLTSSVAEETQLINSQRPLVIVNEGILEGKEVSNEYGGRFYSFQGIPYAEPPLGDLRFKAPLPPKPWNGVRHATELQSSCIQRNIFTNEIDGSEDCLYLNVYTPDLHPIKPFPVMFWIHGGGFIIGSGTDDFYGPEFLVREGVILVTINYRLGAFGFLCLHSEDIPGNAGMKDQVAALKWVHKNIRKFGGDPENVTIFGQSAGGASVGFHLLSPMSKGLFKRAIAQSGVSTCWWANTFQARERAILFAKILGFESEDNEELYDFLKSQPAEKLLEVNLPITYAEASKKYFQLFFGVVSERQFGNKERFFYGDVFENLHNNVCNNVEIIGGYTEDEAYLDLNLIRNLQEVLEQANNYLEFFVPPLIAINNTLSDQIEVGRKIKDFYFRNQNVSRNNLNQLIQFSSSNIFVFWIIEWAKAYAKNKKSKVYLYKLTAKTERNIASRIFGLDRIIGNKNVSTHLDDLPYLFPVKSLNPKLNTSSDVFKLTESIIKLWTNFAKFGNPTPDDKSKIHWAPYTTNKQDYLVIGNKFLEKNTPEKEEIKFLEEIFEKYLPKYLA